ncbi:MAG: cytochrome c2 [Verrucomicrobiales bacterium]|jgi:cytochrome c2
MKIAFTFGLFVAASLIVQSTASALDLPPREIFSEGPNKWDGEVLEITKGRGATIGWYIEAKQAEDVRVTIEYSCAEPPDQEYQISFDGQDRFWEVSKTEGEGWGQAELGVFRARPGLPILVLLVPPSNRKYDHPVRFRRLILESTTDGNLAKAKPPEPPAFPDASPGFGRKLDALHPALTALDLRAEDDTWRISGMAMRGPRELLFTTWEGDLVSLDLDAVSPSRPPPFRRIAQGLSEPMGLAIADDRIFVTEKNQATELIDADGDGVFETYRCLTHEWPATIDYHEYLFGAVIRDSHLYFASSVAMAIRNTHNRQAHLRGSIVKVHIDTGATEIVAGGLRTPNGIGSGPGGSIFITDNQGEWLPGNKLIHLQPEAFYNFRSRPPWSLFDRPVSTPPAVWLPQGEIAMSPTQPILLPESWGIYAEQLLIGDATFGGLQRVFLEEIGGEMQGAVFPFSQGFRHLFNRLVFTAEGELYAGGIARGNDREFIANVSGLTKILFTDKEVFEPLAARLRSNGIEIEFTQPLADNSGWNPAGYFVTQWGYQATQTYGGQKVRHRRGEVRSATVSADRRRVFLELPDLTTNEVLRVRLPQSLTSASGQNLWIGEFWYTVNQIPNNPGIVGAAPENALVMTKPFFNFSGGEIGSVMFQNFCAACHSLDGTKRVGPSFHGLVGATRKTLDPANGQTREVSADAAYLRQSILEPGALIVDGFQNIMPPVGGLLKESEIQALVDFILKNSDSK